MKPLARRNRGPGVMSRVSTIWSASRCPRLLRLTTGLAPSPTTFRQRRSKEQHGEAMDL